MAPSFIPDPNFAQIATLTSVHDLENLQTRIIREYGRDYEVIVPPTKAEPRAIKAESRRTSTTLGELPNITSV